MLGNFPVALILSVSIFLYSQAALILHTMPAAASAAQIIIDPFNPTAAEITVNEGNTLLLTPRVIDSAGNVIDNATLTYRSLSADIATVDSSGNLQGKKAGFSTLTVSSGGVVATTTITVVTITSGVAGFEITGVAQDLARRIYLADSRDHTILKAEDLQKTPSLYAGGNQQPGLINGERLSSRFKNPAFLAFNQAEGSLYVSDSANHVIRRIDPNGRVETLAGTGQMGSDNGPANQATFNNPQGIALDSRGNLWVVDSGNHLVRRINLFTKKVETIAGKAGSTGSTDGTGETARFNAPFGIAVESESLAQQLEREQRGDPPPPVSVIVADTGNSLLRRVRETGQVETVGTGAAKTESHLQSSPTLPLSHSPTPPLSHFPPPPLSHSPTLTLTRAPAPPLAFTALSFNAPTGVATDSLGNIYVSESASNRVKTILRDGRVVFATQTNTLTGPRGIAITESGKVVIAESSRSGRQVSYGEPEITSITPDRTSNRSGTKITIKGKNLWDPLVSVSGIAVSTAQTQDTQTIIFTTPALPSGRATVALQTRGGLAQTSLLVEPVPLNALLPGQITTVAGGTTFIGDGSAATSAVVVPEGITFDADGNLYIADPQNNRIRKVAARTGVITTVAGTGVFGSDGDGRPATLATLANPTGIAIDSGGNLFISDSYRIRRIDATTGIISAYAGRADQSGFLFGDGGPATEATFFRPRGISLDSAGNLFVADFANRRARKVDATTRIITTVAGGGYDRADNILAANSVLDFPTDIAVDSGGNLFIADLNRIRKVDAKTGIITTVAGGGNPADNLGDGGKATEALLNGASDGLGIRVDAAGNLFIADKGNNRIRKVDAVTRVITTVAGIGGSQGFSGDNGPATQAALSTPVVAIADAAGNLLIADGGNARVRKVDAVRGIITTLVGSGRAASTGDGDLATVASLNFPGAVTVDSSGNIFLADTESSRVRKVDSRTRIITNFAGNGLLLEDGIVATQAALLKPVDIALDTLGNLYIADPGTQRIRKVDVKSGIITTVAGMDRVSDFSGDGGQATAATLNGPVGVAVDAAANVYISDQYNQRIRKVAAGTGIISTFAGNGKQGFSGDSGPATEASLQVPVGIAVDSVGNLYIADLRNYRIRRVDSVTGIITTVAGNGRLDSSGDGGEGGRATDASLIFPQGVAVDPAGNIYIVDYDRLLKVSSVSGIITTIAGGGEFGHIGDNGPAIEANVDPVRVALDAAGNLYIADRINHRIRAVRRPADPPRRRP